MRVTGQVSDEFEMKVGVHQVSVLSHLLFILTQEPISRECRTGVPWKVLYDDDFVITADNLRQLIARFMPWKIGTEQKGLRVNIPKTVFIISGADLYVLNNQCTVCRKGVMASYILCTRHNHWVHKKCSDIRRRLSADPYYICPICLGSAGPVDFQPASEVTVVDSQISEKFVTLPTC